MTMGAMEGRAVATSHPESEESEASPFNDVSESVRIGTIEGTTSATGDIRAMVADEVVTGAVTAMVGFSLSSAVKSER